MVDIKKVDSCDIEPGVWIIQGRNAFKAHKGNIRRLMGLVSYVETLQEAQQWLNEHRPAWLRENIEKVEANLGAARAELSRAEVEDRHNMHFDDHITSNASQVKLRIESLEKRLKELTEELESCMNL